MAGLKLNILRPSVNNLCVRVFVRAAELDFEETDVWGHTTEPEYLGKYPPHLTPTIETEGLARPTLGESCAIMAYLANVHGLDRFDPTDPARRAGRACRSDRTSRCRRARAAPGRSGRSGRGRGRSRGRP